MEIVKGIREKKQRKNVEQIDEGLLKVLEPSKRNEQSLVVYLQRNEI